MALAKVVVDGSSILGYWAAVVHEQRHCRASIRYCPSDIDGLVIGKSGTLWRAEEWILGHESIGRITRPNSSNACCKYGYGEFSKHFVWFSVEEYKVRSEGMKYTIV